MAFTKNRQVQGARCSQEAILKEMQTGNTEFVPEEIPEGFHGACGLTCEAPSQTPPKHAQQFATTGAHHPAAKCPILRLLA